MTYLFFSSEGRINRRTLWQGVTLSVGVVLAYWLVWFTFARTLMATMDMSGGAYANLELVGDILYVPVAILVAVMTLNVFAKRWHDLGKAALWWNILLFIPIVNLLAFLPILFVLGLTPGKPTENEWGPVPEPHGLVDSAMERFLAWGGVALFVWIVALSLTGLVYVIVYSALQHGWGLDATVKTTVLGVLALALWVVSLWLSKRAISSFGRDQAQARV